MRPYVDDASMIYVLHSGLRCLGMITLLSYLFLPNSVSSGCSSFLRVFYFPLNGFLTSPAPLSFLSSFFVVCYQSQLLIFVCLFVCSFDSMRFGSYLVCILEVLFALPI